MSLTDVNDHTLLRSHDLAPRNETSADAMPLEIVVCELAVIERLRVCCGQGCDGCAQVLNRIEVLEQGVEITRVPKLIEASWHLRTRIEDG